MPPSATPMSVFQRGGNYLHRLTKLYSDTKQSYESATLVNSTYSTAAIHEKAGSNENLTSDLFALQRDFTFQKDRLLAWGLRWTDENVLSHRQSSVKGGEVVEIDQKLDQAGFGDVVANVMSEIQKLLVESERLQLRPTVHGEKGVKGMITEWSPNIIATSRSLLRELTSCVDVLYALSESRRTMGQGPKVEKKEQRDIKMESDSVRSTSKLTLVDDPRIFERESEPRLCPSRRQDESEIRKHPLFIDIARLDFHAARYMQASDPPPYEEAMSAVPKRLMGTYESTSGVLDVLVDFVRNDDEQRQLSISLGSVTAVAECTGKLAKKSKVSHKSHLELLGFTIDISGPYYSLVYNVTPVSYHLHINLQTAGQAPRTLSSVLSDRIENSDSSSPNLEDRFRLAYNLMLALLDLLNQGVGHGSINSSNVILPGTTDIRHPYLLSSPQVFSKSRKGEEFYSATLYRHPHDGGEVDREWPVTYDVYSLGLVLLEVGLWMPLSKFWKSKYDSATFMSRIKKQYLPKLAGRCGSVFMNVVRKCLHAVEGPHVHNEPVAARDGTLDVASYVLGILKDMTRCCAIDIEGPPTGPDVEYFDSSLKAHKSRLSMSQEGSILDVPITPQSMDDGDTGNNQTKSEEDHQAKKPKLQPQTSLRKWNNVDIPQDHLDEWNTFLMPRLSKLLQNVFQGSPESCSASLMMIGKTPEQAKTTICIQCADVARMKDSLKKCFRAKKGWAVVVLKGDIRRSGKKKGCKKKLENIVDGVMRDGKSCTDFYQEKPRCGASIGAFRDNEHLPPVSFGGTILVDGQPYGMTVHHMLDVPNDDDESEEDDVERCSRPGQFRMQDTSQSEDLAFVQPAADHFPDDFDTLDISEVDDDASDASTIRPDYAAFDDHGNEFWFLEDAPGTEPDLESDDREYEDEYDSDEEDSRTTGDVDGVHPEDDDEFLVTQPAIDDVVDDFFPCAEDRDEDHLASHELGHIHASSGIKRVVRDGIKHEVDWALIKIREERLEVENVIKNDIIERSKAARRRSRSKRVRDKMPAGTSQTGPTTTDVEIKAQPGLEGITPLEHLSGSEVYCCGRTSGFQKGRISKAMTLVKMHGRQSFSSSWCIEGGCGGMLTHTNLLPSTALA